MSRTIEQIQADIITNITNTPELSYVDENNITRNISIIRQNGVNGVYGHMLYRLPSLYMSR